MLRNLFRATCAVLLSVFFLPISASAAVQSGSLIKGKTSSSVYYVESEKRYAFPNDQVYFSWYSDFSSVTTVADSDLANYTLSGNVRFRPGATLIKITTDPKVYAVSQYGTLRWIMNEQTATDLYGSNWKTLVRDVSDTQFIDYVRGSDIGHAVDYNKNEELAVTKFSEDIRSPGYVPPVSQTSAPKIKTASFSIVASTHEATLNQIVEVFATAVDSDRPIAKTELYADNDSLPFAACFATNECHASYTVNKSPLAIVFYARGLDDKGAVITTPLSSRASLNVPQTSSDIQISAAPLITVPGSRVNFTSDAHAYFGITGHKIFAAIPGEPNPIPIKNCGSESACAASSSFYRKTQIYSKITTSDQTLQSAAVTVLVTGNGAPKPKLTMLRKPANNQAVIQLDAPTGESIGFTTIVIGTTEDGKAIALCDKATCEVTVQFSTPQTYTAFTDVGGKLEASNTLNLEP